MISKNTRRLRARRKQPLANKVVTRRSRMTAAERPAPEAQVQISQSILGEPAAIATVKNRAKKAAQEHLIRYATQKIDNPIKLFTDSIDAGIAVVDSGKLAQSTGFLKAMPDALEQARTSEHVAMLADTMGLPAQTAADMVGMAVGMMDGCDAAIDRYVEVLLAMGEAVTRHIVGQAQRIIQQSGS